MALLPARRNSTLSRPGSQPSARWDPFAEFEDLYQRMGQLLGGAFGGGWPPPVQGWPPPADLSETDEAYLAEVELPGVVRDDISVELAGQELATSGEFRDSSSGTHGHAEADQVTAALADGVLTVTVPNTEADKPHRIPVIS